MTFSLNLIQFPPPPNSANIGTSVTNTVVALTHMTNRQDFERAFGGAVLHDMFNLLTVTTLLIVEQLTCMCSKLDDKHL